MKRKRFSVEQIVAVTCPENFVPIRSRDNGSSAQMRSWHEKEPVQRRTDCADTA